MDVLSNPPITDQHPAQREQKLAQACHFTGDIARTRGVYLERPDSTVLDLVGLYNSDNLITPGVLMMIDHVAKKICHHRFSEALRWLEEHEGDEHTWHQVTVACQARPNDKALSAELVGVIAATKTAPNTADAVRAWMANTYQAELAALGSIDLAPHPN